MIKPEILEASLLLILLVDILRSNFLTSFGLILILAALLFIFLGLTFWQYLSKKQFFGIRFLVVAIILAILYVFLLKWHIDLRQNQADYSLHDGAVLTEAATEAILARENPYEINYRGAFTNVFNKPVEVVYDHYMYSPVTFLINIPFKIIFSNFLNFYDFRITLVIFLLLSAAIAVFLVEQKILFLIIFSLNPIFLQSTFYGANEILILFWILATIVFFKFKKLELSVVMLALGTGTKLLIVPFVLLYFVYLLILFKNRNNLFEYFKLVIIYLVVCLLIYLPFLLWNFPSFVDDVIFFHLKGGGELHFIAGFLGIPQILSRLGLISVFSAFPFYLLQGAIAIGFLVVAHKIFKKSLNITTFSFLLVFYFSLIFLFSRILQTSYIAFLSELLILASFTAKRR
ncbi:hypothetical protein HYU92_05910 [Candidatus Curtissbacteria bacterium]|nr:hypothetical protein [Candidatus Curtissbacteria bacterium]